MSGARNLQPPIFDAVEQIADQQKMLRRMEPMRLVSSAVAFGLMTVFLPFWLTLAAMGFDYLFEGLAQGWMQDLNPRSNPQRYGAVLLAVFLMEVSFALPCALIWQQDTEYAKALAVALICMTLFQLVTVRAIHLPLGLAGWLAVAVTAGIGNAYCWIEADNSLGLALSTLGLLAGILYTLGAMRSNHDLHAELGRRGIAADAANRAKGQFLAQMSHELRTPLNAILGMGEIELAQSKSSASTERMQTLVGSARGLAVILDDILEMTALDEAKLQIRPQPVVPQQVISATVELFRPMADQAGLQLDLHICAALHKPAVIDPHRLRQCLSNLLSNALKYTEAGRVSVTASTGAEGALVLDVVDTGPGISAPVRDQIFQPFHRGTEQQTGSGLGLAISRGLARQMGGDLALRPSADGAHFQLCLPMNPAPPPPAAPAAPSALDLTGRRILVVDDIATNRMVACAYVQLLGAITDQAMNGAEALQAIRAHRPDLVLLDLHMPGLSGFETLAKIRALAGPALPVLAMTADVSPQMRQRLHGAGLDGFLAKPLTAETVAAALAPHLARASSLVQDRHYA
jgi:signal transduction histidine kinase/ActR/RegA family two-component response regulator